MDYNKLAKEIYTNNVAAGWWDGDVCIYEKMQLISTEIAEATEGERKDLMDDHLPHRKMAEVELADALIRTLDLGGRLGFLYSDEFAIPHGFVSLRNSIGMQHLGLNMRVSKLATDYWLGEPSRTYSSLIASIVKCAKINSYDIESAMFEKLGYNKTRSDHKIENRKKANGKKF